MVTLAATLVVLWFTCVYGPLVLRLIGVFVVVMLTPTATPAARALAQLDRELGSSSRHGA